MKLILTAGKMIYLVVTAAALLPIKYCCLQGNSSGSENNRIFGLIVKACDISEGQYRRIGYFNFHGFQFKGSARDCRFEKLVGMGKIVELDDVTPRATGSVPDLPPSGDVERPYFITLI